MNFLENGVETLGNRPFRIVRFHLGQIADVANMIAFPIFIHVLV